MHLVDLRKQPGSAQIQAASVPGRMRLYVANVQTVDQVPFTFLIPVSLHSYRVCNLWQQHRLVIREALNTMLVKPLSAVDPEHQNILATLGLPPAAPGTP